MTDMDKLFNYHPPRKESIVKAHEAIREQCKELALTLHAKAPDCRERAIAVRKVEEAMMWGNAAVARNHEVYPED